MGKFLNFDLGGNPTGYSLPAGSGGGGGGGSDDGCFTQLFGILFIIGMVVWGAVTLFNYVSLQFMHFLQWCDANSPFREAVLYYSYAFKPIKIVVGYLIKAFAVFPLSWEFVVNQGITEYPNLNLILGIIFMILIGFFILWLIYSLYRFFKWASTLRFFRVVATIIKWILLLPIVIIVLWYSFLAAKFMLLSVMKLVVLLWTWLFKK